MRPRSQASLAHWEVVFAAVWLALVVGLLVLAFGVWAPQAGVLALR
jgi:hypothetical protein